MTQPRIEPLADPSPESQEILEKIAAEGPPILNLFGTLAHHPRLLKRFNVLGGLFLNHGLLPARERELVILRTVWRTRCEYELGQHVRLSRTVGVTEAELAAVTSESPTSFEPADADLLRLADEAHATHRVSDELWQRLSARWSTAQMLELLTLIGFYRMCAVVTNGAGVQLDPGVPSWPMDAGV